MIRRLWASLRGLPRDEEWRSEVAAHVAMLEERYRRQGMTDAEARSAARRQIGNLTSLEEDRHEMQTLPVIEMLRSDLAYAVRMLRKNPGFTAAAVLTLALGIGTNTAIFSVCQAVLFQPLPYAEPERIVMLWERMPQGDLGTVAQANFVDWQRGSKSFREMAAINPNSSFILGGQNEATRLTGAAVSWNFFSLLGVRFALGRSLLPEEDQPGQNRVAILSHRVWQEHFGADPAIAGKRITLNDASYLVAGVLPAGFLFATNAADFQARSQFDIWTPMALDLQKLQRGSHPLRVVARLKPGVSLAQAQAEMSVMGAAMAQQYPEDNRDKSIGVVPMTDQATGSVRTALEMLLAAVALVLLMACTNVANLLISRSVVRQREMAVRVALGAARGRLALQLLTESLLLASIGGAAGLAVAASLVKGLTAHLPADLSRAQGITVDVRMLLFTAAISLATGLVFGLGPWFGLGRTAEGEALQESHRVAGGAHARMRSVLAAAQIAIAIVLLIGAGLMGKSFWTLMHVAPGFRTERIVTARLSLARSRYADNARIAAFERELSDRLRGRPGIDAAGYTSYLPMGGSDNGWAFNIEGRPPLPTGVFRMAKYRPVSAGYFETIGIPVLRGRSITEADRADQPWVVAINEAMARLNWGAENPVGQRIRFNKPTWRTVIGVVGNVLHEGLDGEAKPEMYMPVDQAANIESGPTIVMRTSLDAGAAAAELRAAVTALDRAMPVDRVATLSEIVSGSVAGPRFRTLLVGAFSLLALAMASIGIYGVMNYLVIQRTREFGIRMSLGASRADVLRLVLRRASGLIAAGTVVGLAGAFALVRLIAKLLFETAPLDAVTFVAVPMVLAAVGLAASYLPARRATRVDPMVALRVD